MIIASLKTENVQLNKKCEKLKKTNNKLLVTLAEYQKKMWQYERKLNIIQSRRLPMPVASGIEDDGAAECGVSENFSAKDMRKLNSIEILKSSDRSFVRELLVILYRNNPSAIQNRMLTKCTGDHKPITPAKKDVIFAMMAKRVANISDDVEKAERMSEAYINLVISKSLYYLKQTMRK